MNVARVLCMAPAYTIHYIRSRCMHDDTLHGQRLSCWEEYIIHPVDFLA